MKICKSWTVDLHFKGESSITRELSTWGWCICVYITHIYIYTYSGHPWLGVGGERYHRYPVAITFASLAVGCLRDKALCPSRPSSWIENMHHITLVFNHPHKDILVLSGRGSLFTRPQSIKRGVWDQLS